MGLLAELLEKEGPRSNSFSPLIPDSDLVLSAIDGPNGTGKTSIHKLVLTVLAAMNRNSFDPYDKHMDIATPGIVGPIEPPGRGLKVFPNHNVTYRQIAKSEDCPPAIATREELTDPFFKAMVFLLARRKIEQGLLEKFPYLAEQMIQPIPENYYLRYPTRSWGAARSTKENPSNRRIGFKDRTTLATLAHQASFSVTGEDVWKEVCHCYNSKYLLRDDATFLLLPSGKSLERGKEVEYDANETTDEVDKYRSAVNRATPWTRRVFEVFNDPTGKNNDLTFPVIFIALALLAIEYEKQQGLNLQPGKEFELPVNLYKIAEDVQEDARVNVNYEINRSLYGMVSHPEDILPLRNGDIEIADINFRRVKMILHK